MDEEIEVPPSSPDDPPPSVEDEPRVTASVEPGATHVPRAPASEEDISDAAKPGAHSEPSGGKQFGKPTPVIRNESLAQKRQERYEKKMRDQSEKEVQVPAQSSVPSSTNEQEIVVSSQAHRAPSNNDTAKPGAHAETSPPKPAKTTPVVANEALAQKRQERYEKKLRDDSEKESESEQERKGPPQNSVARSENDTAKPGAHAEASPAKPKQNPVVANEALAQKRQERYDKKIRESRQNHAVVVAQPGAQQSETADDKAHKKKHMDLVLNESLAQKRQQRFENKRLASTQQQGLLDASESGKESIQDGPILTSNECSTSNAQPGAQSETADKAPKKHMDLVMNESLAQKRPQRYENKMLASTQQQGLLDSSKSGNESLEEKPNAGNNRKASTQQQGLPVDASEEEEHEKPKEAGNATSTTQQLRRVVEQGVEADLLKKKDDNTNHTVGAHDSNHAHGSVHSTTSYQHGQVPDAELGMLHGSFAATIEQEEEEEEVVGEPPPRPPEMLIEATLVDSSRIGIAQASSKPLIMAEAVEEDVSFWKNKRNLAIMALVLVSAIALTVAATCGTGACTAKEEQEPETIYVNITDAPSSSPTEAPTTRSPTEAPTTPFLIDGLPLYSLEALKDPESPQFKAADWIRDDPYLGNYSNERLLQRFALATIAYATNWNDWSTNKFWLSYEQDECQWFSRQDEFAYPDYNGYPCSVNSEYQYLTLFDNRLEGSVPLEVGLLTSLLILDLADNLLVGEIPTEVGNLQQLTQLYLPRSDDLTGGIPSEIGVLTLLQRLELQDNKLTGSIPSQIGNLPEIRDLYLDGNELAGSLPTELSGLSALVYFDIYDNSLSGYIPTEFGRMPSLQNMKFFGNKLTGNLPSQLGLLSALLLLELDQNQLTGVIPSELGLLSALLFLDLDENKLSSAIPTQFGLLRAVGGIELSSNLLSGPIPSELGQLTSLQPSDEDDDLGAVKLDNNNLSGSIPSELGRLVLMTSLRLHYNSLTSTTPRELEDLQSLRALRLHENNLSGNVEDLAGLGNTSLEVLTLQDNDLLTGTLPDSLCNLMQLNFDCSDNLCGCDCDCPIVVATNNTN